MTKMYKKRLRGNLLDVITYLLIVKWLFWSYVFKCDIVIIESVFTRFSKTEYAFKCIFLPRYYNIIYRDILVVRIDSNVIPIPRYATFIFHIFTDITLWRGSLRRSAGEIVLFTVRRLLMGLLLRTIRYVRRSAASTADFYHVMRSSPLWNWLFSRCPVFLLLVVFVVIVVVVIWMITENRYTTWMDIIRRYCQLLLR